jgi:hypothetical protein
MLKNNMENVKNSWNNRAHRCRWWAQALGQWGPKNKTIVLFWQGWSKQLLWGIFKSPHDSRTRPRRNWNENDENFQSGSGATLKKSTETKTKTTVKMDDETSTVIPPSPISLSCPDSGAGSTRIVWKHGMLLPFGCRQASIFHMPSWLSSVLTTPGSQIFTDF